MALDSDSLAAVQRVRLSVLQRRPHLSDHPYLKHDFNVHRWIVAWQNEQDAAKNLQRHLKIREIMPLPPIEDEESRRMATFAPITILGRNKENDNKVVLLEQSGKIDIHGLVENIRLNAFMRSKFAMMEQLQKKVEAEERLSGRQSGGLLIMDLAGLNFSPTLLSVLAGPYRIMWGTLFEQFPQLIQSVIVLNAPAFANILYQTCQPFIPSDYKEKIQLCSNTKILSKVCDLSCLPEEYGGSFEFEIVLNPPTTIPPTQDDFQSSLQPLSIPAGSFVVEKFRWSSGRNLEFLLRTEQEFTYWIFFSDKDTINPVEWEEIQPGCERPALKQTDRWLWKTPKDGFYYIRYGNEKAWLFSVTVERRISTIEDGNSFVPQHPVDTFIL